MSGHVRLSDIQRCPKLSLSPHHYRADGTCKCDLAAEAKALRAEARALNKRARELERDVGN